MQKILYYTVYGLLYGLSLLPLRLLYVLSDAIYLLIYHVVHYRRRVVWKNLRSSFPDRTEADLRQIEKDFYHVSFGASPAPSTWAITATGSGSRPCPCGSRRRVSAAKSTIRWRMRAWTRCF